MSVQWVPTTETKYYDMMGCLPPAAYGDDSFQVGEPMSHRGAHPTFASFKIENGNYYESTEALTFREFSAEVKNAAYCYG